MYSLTLIDNKDIEVTFDVGSLLEGLDLLQTLRDNLETLNTRKITLKPKEDEINN